MMFVEGKVLKKTDIIKNGVKKEVIFRLPKRSDVKDCMRVINTLVEEGAYLETVDKFTLEQEKQWMEETIKAINENRKVCVFVEYKGRYCGSAEVRRGRQGSSHTGEIGIAIGKELRGFGIGRELLEFVIQLAVDKGIEVMTLRYLIGNNAARDLFKKLGFTEAGNIPKLVKRGDAYYDEIIMYRDFT